MKKLISNIVLGIIISIVTLGIVTQTLGSILTQNNQTEWLIQELFTNGGIKFLTICLNGLLVGILVYLIQKYEKSNKIIYSFLYAIVMFGIIILINRLVGYTYIFIVAYIAVMCLIMCILDFCKYISVRKDINDINRRLDKR